MESLSLDPATIADTTETAFFSGARSFRTLPTGSFVSRIPDVNLADQKTLRSAISCVGIGLHTGARISLRMEPAPADTGIVFQRTDIAAQPLIACYGNVVDTRLSTVLGESAVSHNRVATIEHLMAALHGRGIDNVRIFVNGPELPVLDGSAADFLFLLDCAGIAELDEPRREIEILKPLRVENGDAFAMLRPGAGSGLSLQMTIDFAAGAIGCQKLTVDLDETVFRRDLSFSRTFTDRREIDALHRAGLALGGSLDNAIVVDGMDILNPTGLRARDEFVRHKLLDAVGDLYLAGARLRGEFVGHKSGHQLNNQLLLALFADRTAWRWVEKRVAGTAVPRRVAA
ncbi:UDP-3-O-acyl-N-acetylglucosamine deacetylase [Acetobacter oeni]|uniref:UDP-3-O-acyl-N-acetylglucosamine deacetylase n=1 Tax=Acetobacter oeni TaxID=304077 RepID=A0A511XHY1_9PROT|nr:UDP-3-O-acyl-N-acetylglucosamine deacetylase [Acetobacter oeni]MBB3882524.1 UDP-3-O-[3-hydroxymyristoyl] N-acetylglucosamine deacetylase [Acetobacter oeni]NHO18664.1 UDP-3-O-acyl-N-acetylglucosamine deacetylase [Acetobacter oeni]GBR11852.1 UDP-3-O-[3-hydroxymyristoyl] N-acetylglucosamine deacetylase [Acetobacter oeni LMG 21952]GEN62539.1 UDP-3-O-acyl-N-acetylglucosamine deacetylase [Acetobacter oeni]